MAGAADDIREALKQVSDPMALLVGLFTNAPVGFQIYTPDGHCLLTNQAFRRIFGTAPPPEYNIFEDPLLHGIGILEIARRAFAGETIVSPPAWYDTPNQPLARGGVPRRCAVGSTWLPLFDSQGRVAHIALIFEDVTAELLAREQAEAERARLQALLDNAPAIVFVRDLEGRHLVVSHEAERTFGINPRSAMGKTAQELFGAEAAERDAAANQQMLQSRRPLQQVDTLPTLQGEREFLVTRFPIFGSGGEPVAQGGIAIDISERRRAEEQLRKSEALFSQMFRGLPMAALLSRVTDRRFLDVNDAWVRLTGYTREENLGHTSVELGIWADPERREELFRELAERGVVHNFAARLRSKAGALHDVLVSVDVMEVGSEKCLLTLAHDVTDVRQLERELRQAQKMEAVGRLAGGVAHDFNNILTAITGANGLMLELLPPDDPMRRYAEQIKRSSMRAATLTRQLLTFTRKQPMQPVVLDPNEAVRGVVDMLHRMIGADIELRSELNARGRVKADPGAVEQVVLNLAVNARDAMPNGGRLTLRTADVENSLDGPWVMLSVADSGTGMDAATKARLFEPFFTTKEQGKGTGLGLSTVYGIVKQSGGHITVDSEPGHGADFRVYLPRQSGLPAQEAAPPAQEVPRGHETVLLAEDDEAVRDFVAFELKRLGYRVLQANDGIEALGVAAAFGGQIDLLLSDVVMPRLDGRELARRLLESRPGLKVVHMSGYPGEGGHPNGHGLAKPFDRHQLARCIRDALEAPG
jgi:PAS domain S-box-containing protein